MPNRIQMKRNKGFNLQNYSMRFNGLRCIVVSRPTKWGNPFRLTPDGYIQYYSTNRNILNPWIMWSYSEGFETKDIVELYERWIKGEFIQICLPNPPSIEELKGYNLACWCPLVDKDGNKVPCHADILLKLANANQIKNRCD